MKPKILFIERKFKEESVSVEKAFRQIARSIAGEFETQFQQMPYGWRVWDTVRNLMLYRRKPADLYHIAGHVHYIALLLSPRNTVLSIMDTGFVENRGRLRRFIIKKLYFDLPIRRLKYITAISEHTRLEIVRHTGCDPAKVRTIELPLHDHIYPGEPRPFNTECPRILQVGVTANKNIPRLTAALRGIKCRLVIVGAIQPETAEALRDNEIDFENPPMMSDDSIRAEYERADIVAFCSTFEGFGLPIIEGQAMNKPVITSGISPMTETSGGAACLVDPENVENIREGILKIINDADYRAELVRLGAMNARRYSPEAIGERYAELYREVLGDGASDTDRDGRRGTA